MNRNYVRPELRKCIFDLAAKVNEIYPGVKLNYLEANFPFGNGFPLFPHLSHNDGKKLDLAFFYEDAGTGKPSNDAPSYIGYGISEEARPGEVDASAECQENGYWQYSLLRSIVPQNRKSAFVFDEHRTSYLIKLLANQPLIEKIFIEPHLKTRLKINNRKIRFHGCQAVRHDDHIHIQIK